MLAPSIKAGVKKGRSQTSFRVSPCYVSELETIAATTSKCKVDDFIGAALHKRDNMLYVKSIR